MKKFEKEPYHGQAIERLRVIQEVVSLVSLVEPSRGLFLLCAGIVSSGECEPTACLTRGSALEEQCVCWRAVR